MTSRAVSEGIGAGTVSGRDPHPEDVRVVAVTTTKVSPSRVRYIKLGEGGRWEKACIEQGVNRIGFGTADPARFELCNGGQWDNLYASFIADGKDRSTAKRFVKEVRTFFEDDGSILWITFHAQSLYWGMADSEKPKPRSDLEGASRPIRDGWRSTDINGEPLTKNRLSGALVKLTAYRGTSCDVDVADYVVRRVNGQKTPQAERAIAASREVASAALDLIRLLTPQDFELLVDLVFSTSGWRRVGVVGRTQETLDLDLILPSTGERAFVQVKSRTTQSQLDDYVERLDERGGNYSRMFFVYHSGEAKLREGERRVSLIGPERLPDMIVDAGLVKWLIEKTS